MQIFPTQFKKGAGQFLNLALDTLLPPRCVVSGAPVEQQGMIAPQAWAGLDFIAAPYCAACGFPFEFEVEKDSLCASCLADRPPFEMARAVLKYNDASRPMILGFKHADKTHIVRAFAPWLKRAGAPMLRDADMVVPVPLHYWRLLSRRYNQAALMGAALGEATGLDYLPDGLRRVRSTPSQGRLNAKERHKNVRRAFVVEPKHKAKIQGKTILLIDDVYTTGATAKECTKALLKARAEKVHVLTLARVVRGEF